LRRIGYWCDVELEDGADRLTAKSVIGWMDGVEAKLGECGVYAANWCWRSIMQDEYARYKTRKLWCAAYISSIIVPPGWDGNWYLWQYTSSGRLPGYAGNLDMNKLNPAWSGGNYMLNVQPLSQKDLRWKNDNLGTSASTIGGYGCLITCVAMALNYYGKDTDPGRLNKDLIRVGGYQNGNLLIFDKVTSIYPSATMDWGNYLTSGVTGAKLDAVLASGRPAIVQVDFDPTDPDIDQHWVLVIGKDARGYIMADPIDGKILPFSERYNAALRMVVYNGSHQEAGGMYQAKVLVDYLRIRRTPAIANNDTGKRLMAGNIVSVLEESGGWLRIADGWIFAEYTEKLGGVLALSLEERVAKLEAWVEAHV
jgi:hypothetical protein